MSYESVKIVLLFAGALQVNVIARVDESIDAIKF
jgi:hypothetical protein